MERSELLSCRDVSLGYEGQSVLTHLNLSIRAGDYLCVVGDNGSGKSTLLRGLLGLLPPQSGEIWRAPELRQRVLLARALCAAGRLLILDEPITGLDPAAAQDLYKTLAYLNEKEDMAVVMVTHDLRAALRQARTVLHIGRSSLFYGSTEEYLSSPQGRRFREVEP